MACTHEQTNHDCPECHKRDFMRAMVPLFVVTDSHGHLPVSEIHRLAMRLAAKMESILASKPEGREWGIALAAEACFDLAHTDKDPLPTHFHILDDSETTFLPTILAPILGGSNGDVRRLLKGGGIRVNGEQHKDVEIATESLNAATISVGKQGVAVFCHKSL